MSAAYDTASVMPCCTRVLRQPSQLLSALAGFLARTLLESGDRVKFARVDAGPSDCRTAVEEAYRLVDLTKPREEDVAAPSVAAAP